MGIFDFLKRSSGNVDPVQPAATHEENWATYLTRVDGDAIGSIVVDLGLREIAPVAGFTEFLIIEIPMLRAKEDGLPSNEEFSVLATIEKSFEETLAIRSNAVFAGHLHCEGITSLYFYVGTGADLDQLLEKSIQRFEGYSLKHRLKHDPDWSIYFEFLYPEPIEMQRLGNEAIIRNLMEHGDELEKERKVEHWIYFPSEADRSRFLTSVVDNGFTVEDLSEDKDYELPYKAQISRDDKVTQDATDVYILDLWQRARDCNGNYDGWETFIVRD